MYERRRVSTVYRGRRRGGEWWIEDGRLYVAVSGRAVRNVACRGGRPSELAERELWRHLQETDGERPRFNWYRLRDVAELGGRDTIWRTQGLGGYELFALALVVALAVALLTSLLLRVQDGRCQPNGFRGGLDCSYPSKGARDREAPPASRPTGLPN